MGQGKGWFRGRYGILNSPFKVGKMRKSIETIDIICFRTYNWIRESR